MAPPPNEIGPGRAGGRAEAGNFDRLVGQAHDIPEDLKIASGLAWIEPASDGSFAFAPAPKVGIWARMLPVFDDDGIIDVVAWERGRPSPWWLYRRNLTVLGDHTIRLAALTGGAVQLTAFPEKYLDYYAGHAACIVDWAADLRGMFEGVREVRCDSPALERRLHETLSRQAAAVPFQVAS